MQCLLLVCYLSEQPLHLSRRNQKAPLGGKLSKQMLDLLSESILKCLTYIPTQIVEFHFVYSRDSLFTPRIYLT